MAPLVQRATEANRDGDAKVAERLCLDVLELVPIERDALRVLYNIRKAETRHHAVESLIRRLVALDANDFWAVNELALMLLNKGNIAEAEVHARNAVRLAPQNPQAHNLMGMVLTEAHKPHLGEYHYRRVIDLSGRRDPILLANLAWNLKTQGKMTEARRLYEESAGQAPDVPQTMLGWARMEEADRQFGNATAILDRAQAKFPDDPGLLLARAVLLRRTGRYEQALETLQTIAHASRNGSLSSDELLEKGALLDRMGRYEEAFAAFEEGKRLTCELTGTRYQSEQARQLSHRLGGFFTAKRLATLPRVTDSSEQTKPIFVLGFPRSGTTLVEQMLSAHPRISAGDELPLINEITVRMPGMFDSPLPYPEALAELWMADHRDGLDKLRDYYLDQVGRRGIMKPGAAWLTDKMPLNEMHLGLIALVFPTAPLVHVMRHPLDVVLSVFATQLTHGFCCSYELETVARHYVLVMHLVEHYRHEMALRYLTIRYEDMVYDQEATVRRLLDFIGEPFDARCLRFHENLRYARTASYAQVSQKLYDRSIFRYRNYIAQIEAVIPILQPVIEQLGYKVD
ncbi:sulfotransferase [Rhodopila sp.]|uniref:sulfotransferase n=1 Tax=Rhodopila sp. TaxID=2480087 RepID=UPI003D10565A